MSTIVFGDPDDLRAFTTWCEALCDGVAPRLAAYGRAVTAFQAAPNFIATLADGHGDGIVDQRPAVRRRVAALRTTARAPGAFGTALEVLDRNGNGVLSELDGINDEVLAEVIRLSLEDPSRSPWSIVAEARLNVTGSRSWDGTTEGPITVDGVPIPDGAEVARFDIPVWEGQGTTRIQYFIEDDEICIIDAVPATCGAGDDRGFAEGRDIGDYELPARVRIVLDHESGEGIIVSYPTHGSDGSLDALPVELHENPHSVLPEDYPSQVHLYNNHESTEDSVSMTYRFLNSQTPRPLAGVAPAIGGALHITRGEDGEVVFSQSKLDVYPSVEIIRDHEVGPDRYTSEVIYTREQHASGPEALLLPETDMEVSG